jgi:hypothetical protein
MAPLAGWRFAAAIRRLSSTTTSVPPTSAVKEKTVALVARAAVAAVHAVKK